MRNLNAISDAGAVLLGVAGKVSEIFKNNLIGAEFGIAYGGGVESIGKLWKNKGIIYGFDTFTGQPKEIALKDPACNFSSEAVAAKCMDQWYKKFGMQLLSIEYQQSELNRQGLDNVKLVKGLIDENTKLDYIPYLNYVLLDFDFPLAMENAYNIVEPKLVKNAYLCLHDVIAPNAIPGLDEWYKTILQTGKYKLIAEYPSTLAVLQKI